MIRNWVKIQNGLPETKELVLVKGALHIDIALGKMIDKNTWDVQPFKGAWYQTDTQHIDVWSLLDDALGDTTRTLVHSVIKEIFESLQEDLK